jgi:hypothetical protein
MTKLVIVLAVVVGVILVVVFVAVRNMRAEDPEEFADRPRGRDGDRSSRDGRDPRYDRREPAGRQPARTGRGGPSAGRQAGNGSRPAADRDERRDHQADGYDRRARSGRGYDGDSGSGQRRTPADRRGAPPQRGGQDRRHTGPGRTGESQAPARARQARNRPPGDSSEWDSSEWEKLSDIDYWTELASDKPLTTTAQPAAQAPPARPARPAADRDAETAALQGSGEAAPGGTVPREVPRRDPVTGLPVRGHPQPAGAGPADDALADAGLADTVLSHPGLAGAPAARAGFAAAPVPSSPAPDQMRAAAGRADFAAAPLPAGAAQDQMRPLAEPRLPLPKHAGLPEFPEPARRAAPNRPPVDPDDDPLTSPSFPRIPAPDSRSYRNGGTDTPAGGSPVPARHLAPTQQFASYGSPAPQRPAARHASGQHAVPADVGGDTDRTNPNGYPPDPLLDGNPYPPPAASAPTAPAPAAPMASPSGNPYGSYVTSDSQDAAFGYDAYPAMPGNGHGPYLPAAVPGDAGQAANGYWQPAAPDYPPGAGTSGYQDGRAQPPDARDAGARTAGYRNGYGRHDRAAYVPGGYSAGSPDQAGYARQDPYGHDGYGGYPGYGPTGH